METITKTAEAIGKKARALKHCDKLLNEIDIHGHTDIILNCGLRFQCNKGDEIHLKLQTKRIRLFDEINSYVIIAKTAQTKRRARCSTRTKITPFPSPDQISYLS